MRELVRCYNWFKGEFKSTKYFDVNKECFKNKYMIIFGYLGMEMLRTNNSLRDLIFKQIPFVRGKECLLLKHLVTE